MHCALSDTALQALLDEDVPCGDLTTVGLRIGDEPARLTMYARQGMWVCGTEEAARMFSLCGASVSVSAASGSHVAGSEALMCASGRAAALHRAWKTAQTLIEWLSGLASSAAEIRQSLRAGGFDLPLACTRKNMPGSRALAAKAVRAGGAVAHRLGLSETLLVFAEHRLFVDKAALPARFAELRRQHPEKKLVAEASDWGEALWLAECGADVLQLERFSPSALAECKAALGARGRCLLIAPAGGVTLSNALDYARAGADFLISSVPYFAAPRDVSVVFERG